MRLMQGDCLELMGDIPDGSVDMVLCDLPYGTTACAWDSVIPFTPLWEQYMRICKRNGAIVLFSAEPFTSALVMSKPQLFRYDLIWVKDQGTDFLNANRKPLRRHENICVFFRDRPVYNPQFGKGRPYKASQWHKGTTVYGSFRAGMFTDSDGRRNPTSILEFTKERGYHPTQKPVPLLEYLIRTYTNPGDTVLDNCMGSGSTGVACVHTGRNFIGIELDPGYFETAKKRIETAGEQLSLFEN